MAFFLQDDHLRNFNFEFKIHAKPLKERLYAVASAITFYRNNFMLRLTDEVMQGLITGGIPQNFYKRTLSPIIPEKQNQPTVLKIEDLKFGFIIWLISCGISILFFSFELLWIFYLKLLIEIKNLIGLILVLKNLILLRSLRKV